jgi:CP family cyanate transporter-like MFS transporter
VVGSRADSGIQPTVDGAEPPPWRRHPVLLGIVIALVSFNLRPAVASVGPVLQELREQVPLSGTGAALLTTIPVLCFGLLALAAPRLAQRAGIEPVLMVVLLTLMAALLVRVADGSPLLFFGTVVAGGAIAVGNVLLPPLIKRDFPARAGLMMGVYSMTVSGSAAVASGATVPLGDLVGLGWRGALGIWAVPAAVAGLAWLPQLRGHTVPPRTEAAGPSLLRSPLAWQVTIFFGLQALSFYAVLAWLPTLYREEGYTAAAAGLLLSVSGLVQIPVNLLLPAVATRAANQVAFAVGGTALIAAGLLGLLLAPASAPYLWVILTGVGQGSCFALGLNLFVLRTSRISDTARLSAMAQSIGYVVCAFGPLLVGVLHVATGSWTAPLVLLLALLVPQLAAGILAGRARTVHSSAEPRADRPVGDLPLAP